MADQLQLRGGPTAQSEIFVGAEREITVDTGLKRLRIHDGVTAGGHLLNGKADLDSAIAAINQTIDDNEADDAQARLDLKVLLEQELADLEAEDAAARVLLQTAIDAEVTASAAYDIIQDNRLAVLEVVSDISKKELDFITLIGTANPTAGQVGVNSLTPSTVEMIVLPKTDANGKTVGASDFLENDRIALKQPNGSAAVYVVNSSFDFGDHIRLILFAEKTVLGAGGDLAFIENGSVSAVFEDTSVTRGAMTAGFSTEATARESAVTSLTALITALQTRATALELDPVTKTYVDTQISDLINGAPDALNQLNEIIAAFEGADTSLIGDLSGLGVRITALENDSTTATAVATEATTRAAADTALSGRLDTLEADDTTATALAAETAARIAADATNLAAAQTFATQAVANVIDASPAALDTLNEIAASLGDDADFITTITSSVAAVQADVDANETAINASLATETTARTSADNILAGRLDAAEGKASYTDPTTQTLLSAETASRTSADTALSGRIDTLEADPTTQTLLSAEATSRSSADTALSARLDTAEAKTSYTDPTTQTLLSAETTSRVAADSALSTRLDTAEAKTSYNDPTTQTLLTAETTARTAAVITLQTNIDTITTEQAAQEARLLQAGLFTGILYVSNFTGG